MISILQVWEAKLTETNCITQISRLEPERGIVNAYQLPYPVVGTIVRVLPH